MADTPTIPPHDAAAERAVLGCALLEGAPSVLRAAERLAPEDFFLEAHRDVWRAAAGLAKGGQPVDLVTVHAALARDDRAMLAGQPAAAYLALLAEEGAVRANLPAYVDIVAEHGLKREALQDVAKLAELARNGSGPDAVLAAFRASAERLALRRRASFPAPLDAAQFFAAPPAAPSWLVGDVLLEASNGWLGAGAKVGKSYLALDLLLALALGQPWLGHFAVPRPVTVVLIEEEDSAWRVYNRLKRLCRGRGLDAPPDNFKLSVRRGWRIDDATLMDELQRWLEANRARFVAWDVFNKLHVQDERRPDQIMPVLWRLDKLRNDLGCASLVAHHSRKPSPSGPDLASGGQKLRGPSEFWGWADNSLYLAPLKGRGVLIVEPESKDAILEPFKVHLACSDCPAPDCREASHGRTWVYDGVHQAKADKGAEARRAIIRALEEAGSAIGTDAIARAAQLAERTVKGHLKALHSDGVIEWLPDPDSRGAKKRIWRLAATDAGEPDEPRNPAEPGF